MVELRLSFDVANGDYTVRLDPNWSGNASQPLPFTPFLDEDDFEDLRWYLEEFMDLPDGGAVVRAQRIEVQLKDWGRKLYDALFKDGDNRELLNHLLDQPPPRLLTLATRDSRLLRLPWELMADTRGPLFRQDITIRRQLETARRPIQYQVSLPLRVLVVVSRPSDLGFIDPRLSTRSMLDALVPLGEQVQVDFCRPPTLARLEEMLREARRRRAPYTIVHFDGHGTFLPDIELGALCFEKPDSATVLTDAKTDFVRADRMGELLAAYEIPLVILEACRTGTIGKVAVFRSVAPRLIEAGIGSVLSMSHAVHVEAARVLLERFYRELVTGVTVGQALEQGRAALIAQPYRWIESGPGGRTVELKDWHLPHLYQRSDDLALVPPSAVQTAERRRTSTKVGYEYDAFLSYTHTDAVRVHAIHKLLTEKHGLRVFLDEKQISHGPLHERCRDGIQKSHVLLLACSERSLKSDWVKAEHNMARARDPLGRHIVPIVLDNVELPLDLKALLYFDFQDPNHDEDQAAKLVAAIHAAIAEQDPPAAADIASAPKGRFRLASRDRESVGSFPPAPIYGFHGRAHELYELERQFRSHRAVLLHAMGGMGKTTLASEAAVWWTRTGLFPDGACFLSFEQFTSAERAIQVLGTYLDGTSFESLPAADQHRRALELFDQKNVLVVWDNFESVLPQFAKESRGSSVEGQGPDDERGESFSGPRPSTVDSQPLYAADERGRLYELFRELTASPNGKGRLLITCRPAETGLGGARRTELQGLARPDSLWLLVRVLETAGVDLNDPRLGRDKLNKLLDLLADHPLSIELVGPHLKQLTPEAIITDFGPLLAQFKVGAGIDRNESLLASLAFSTCRLSESAQAALSWLSRFSGGVFERVLLEISELDPQQWAVVRTELEATALIRVEHDIDFGGPYVRFHPTLIYAANTTPVLNPELARQLFVKVYYAVTQVVYKALHGLNPRGGLEVLVREEANLRTAVRWAVEDQQYALASALGSVFRDYLEMSGRLRERDAWITWLSAEVRKGGFTREAAAHEQQQALLLAREGNIEEAITMLEALIQRLRNTKEFDSAFHLADATDDLGRVLIGCGRSERAIPVLEDAVVQWQSLVEAARLSESRIIDSASVAVTVRGNLGATLGDLANALRSVGRLDAALVAAERALEIGQGLGQERNVATTHAQSAQILLDQGRHVEADARYDDALISARRAGDKVLEGAILQHQGGLARRLNQYARAASLYQRALKLFQEMNDEASVMRTYNLLGAVEHHQDRLPEARAWYDRSREIALRLGAVAELAQAAQNIGIVCQEEGEVARKHGREPEARKCFAAAKSSIQEALRLIQQLENEPFLAMTLGQLAKVHLLLSELDEAEQYARQCLEIDERLGIIRELPADYRIMANIARARGDVAQATEWEAQRDVLLEEIERRSAGPAGLPVQVVQALQQLSTACAQAGVDGSELGPGEESALAHLAQLPAPLSDLASFLRQLATGQLPAVPSGLPAELHEFLTQLLAAIREAKQ